MVPLTSPDSRHEVERFGQTSHGADDHDSDDTWYS